MDSNKNTTINRQWLAGGLAILLALLLFTPGLRAQTFNSGGTGALGAFLNPLTVNDTSATPLVCNYDKMFVDMAQGKVFARPYRTGTNATCNTTLVDITSQVFTPTITSFDGSKGVLEVTDFTLRLPNTGGTSNNFPCCPFFAMEAIFQPNASNAPIILRATGNVTIGANTAIDIFGNPGSCPISTFAPGNGGLGGPGGYRGGNGGAGGATPSPGGAGAGPGGGAGGNIGSIPTDGAKTLTTGILLSGAVVPVGDDLLVQMRGGSGGGGTGGSTSGAGCAGSGGGGAILIAAGNGTVTTGTITINGGILAFGGDTPASTSNGMPGSGGVVRLVGATITGGTLSGQATSRIRVYGGSHFANQGGRSDSPSSPGLIRLEAFNISYPGGNLEGPTSAAVVPGKIFVPTDTQPVFLKFSDIRNSADSVSLGTPPAGSQDVPGRTGAYANVDVSLASTTSVVTVRLIAGPNTVSNPFPSGKTVTVVVSPANPQQGQAVTYAAPIICTTPGVDCTATVPSVFLPLGFVSMSAFTVVTTTSTGTLARMFPQEFEGEPIESVRIQTDGKDTEYVLIAKSGKEFPYRPGK